MSNYGYTGYQIRSGYKKKIREKFNYTCQLCGGYGEDVDHIVPWAISHDNSEDNLRVLCHRCNCATRRTRVDANPYQTLDQWYEHIQSELDKEQ